MILSTYGNARKGVMTTFNKNKFLAKVIERGYTVADIALKLGINRSTLYRKINMETDFTRNEISTLKECLNINLDEMNEIFFAQ